MLTIHNVAYPGPNNAMAPRSFSAITDFIVHHTDGSRTQTPLDIDAEHRGEGWAMIGYNFVITPNGNVYDGRPLNVIPAAAYGRNTESVNVVLVGQFQPDAANYTGPPTEAQLLSLRDLALEMHRKFPSIVRTIGHRDVAPMFYNGDGDYATACPGDKLYAELPAIRSYVAAQMNKH